MTEDSDIIDVSLTDNDERFAEQDGHKLQCLFYVNVVIGDDGVDDDDDDGDNDDNNDDNDDDDYIYDDDTNVTISVNTSYLHNGWGLQDFISIQAVIIIYSTVYDNATRYDISTTPTNSL